MPRRLSLSVLVLLGLICIPSAIQATERLRIEPGTRIPVRLEGSLGTKDFYQWHSFGNVRTVSGTLMQDMVTSDGQVALPSGTKIRIAVLESKRAGHITGRSRLRLGLYSVRTPCGEVIPLDGYPTDLNHHKADREGTAHGNRGLVKDGAVDFSSVVIGAGAGLVAAGPPGAVLGAGGGLLVAAIWTVARRGPDLTVPAGTILEFVLGRPVSLMATGDFVDGTSGSRLQPSNWGPTPSGPSNWGQAPAGPSNWGTSSWGRGPVIAPSEDLLVLADRVEYDPDGVLQELRQIRFRDRPYVDRAFAKYLQAVARFQKGDHSGETLSLMREAYSEARTSSLSPQARAEMARNLVFILRASERNWERDPVLNDPQVQAALVGDTR